MHAACVCANEHLLCRLLKFFGVCVCVSVRAIAPFIPPSMQTKLHAKHIQMANQWAYCSCLCAHESTQELPFREPIRTNEH